jgi:hypothetical protein
MQAKHLYWLLAMLLFLLPVAASSPGDWYVSPNGVDSTSCGAASLPCLTLSIALRNSAGGADGSQRILLVPSATAYDMTAECAEGGAHIFNRNDLTIAPADTEATPVVLDCMRAGRHLQVANSSLTLQGLTLQYGVAIDGAAIHVIDSFLQMVNCNIRYNELLMPPPLQLAEENIEGSEFDMYGWVPQHGGSIFLSFSALSAVGCSFLSNTAAWSSGAAILWSNDDPAYDYIGTNELTACTFFNHSSANSGATVFLGGVYLDEAQLVVNDCHFENGQSIEGNSGALYLSGGVLYNTSLIIQDSIFVGNMAGKSGGAIGVKGNYTIAAQVQLIESLLETNSALQGGALIFVLFHGYDNLLSIVSSQFHSNVAIDGGGGAIAFFNLALQSSGNQLLFSDSTFEANHATDEGAAILTIYQYQDPLPAPSAGKYDANNFIVHNVSFTNHVIDCMPDQQSFGDSVDGGVISIRFVGSSLIDFPFAEGMGNTFLLTSVNFNGNKVGCAASGGCLSLMQGAPTSTVMRLEDTHFLNTLVVGSPYAASAGGAVSVTTMLDSGSVYMVTDSSFVSNVAFNASSGAFNLFVTLASSHTQLSFTGTAFLSNRGGTNFQQPMDGSRTMVGGTGGAVFVQLASAQLSNILIDSCTFDDNWADLSGGAVTLEIPNPLPIQTPMFNSLLVQHSLFTRNHADHSAIELGSSGGAINVQWVDVQYSNISLFNCTFEDNSVEGIGAAANIVLTTSGSSVAKKQDLTEVDNQDPVPLSHTFNSPLSATIIDTLREKQHAIWLARVQQFHPSGSVVSDWYDGLETGGSELAPLQSNSVELLSCVRGSAEFLEATLPSPSASLWTLHLAPWWPISSTSLPIVPLATRSQASQCASQPAASIMAALLPEPEVGCFCRTALGVAPRL